MYKPSGTFANMGGKTRGDSPALSPEGVALAWLEQANSSHMPECSCGVQAVTKRKMHHESGKMPAAFDGETSFLCDASKAAQVEWRF